MTNEATAIDIVEPTTVQDDVDKGYSSLAAALEAARDKLLDRSLRNKLISTPLTSSRARHVRVFDELSDEAHRTLLAGKAMTFAAAASKTQAEDDDAESSGVWVPPEGDEVDDRGVAARHRDTRLQTHLTAEGLQKRLLSLFYEGQTLEEEQGVNILFLALGFLEWREARQSETPRFAPLVLLPVDLVRDGARDRFKLKVRPDDLITNVSLQAWLKEQFGIALPDLPEGEDWSPSSYCATVEAAVGGRAGWRVHPNEILLGFFSFAKFLLWRDLDPANWPDPSRLLANPLLRQILLRDDEPLEDVPVIGDHERVDEVFPPAELVHITDADSSQAIAIQEAMAGKNLVIQGPPGTGKSQTITNIIAGAVQRGRSVLFVAEKMAALDVVHQRLVDRKLGVICLELHSRKSSKTQVLEQLRRAREAAAPPAWPSTAKAALADTQAKLRAHADRLHAQPSETLSAFALMGRMSLLKAQKTPAPTFDLPEAATWVEAQVTRVRLRAAQLGERLAIAGVPAAHPWRGVGAGVPDMLEQERLSPLVEAASRAASTLLERTVACRARLGVREPTPLARLGEQVAALRHLSRRPPGMDTVLSHPTIVENVDRLAAAAAAGRSLRVTRDVLDGAVRPEAWGDDWSTCRRIVAGEGRSLLRVFSSRYRQAIGDLRGVWIGKLPRHDARIAALDALVERRRLAGELADLGVTLEPLLGELWKGEASDWEALGSLATWVDEAVRFRPLDLLSPTALSDPATAATLAEDLDTALAACTVALKALKGRVDFDDAVALDGRQQMDLTADDTAAAALSWRTSFHRLVEWPPLREDLAWLREIGAGALADQVFRGEITASQVEPGLMLAAYEAMWTKAREADPEIERTQGDELDNQVRRFKKADVDRIRMAADEVARAHIDRKPTGSAGAVGILVEEMKKARRLKAVRKLVEEAGEAMQRFTPVFLMSPLSIAQYVPPGLLDFDMLVIDEASQVRPEDALGAIARCRQVVVVGDDKQLPPTNFFNRMVNDDGPDDEDDDLVGEDGVRRAAVKDIESILNLCSRFPERMLRWHYRSEHPALIATSNRNFYRDKLMLPPSVVARANDGHTGLVFHKVAEGGYDRGRTARNEIEAEDVAQAVLEHARRSPELSLGVGTFSVAQRDAVRDRIDDLARRRPELEAFLGAKTGTDRFFVKNLENIQGDERDVIFISVGYGRDRDGRLTQQFGPVGRAGGERRLNVLITRARKRCEVFSSIVAEDITFEGVGKPGVVALKEFLKLARDGYADFNTLSERSFDSEFEEAVAHVVRELGYSCHPQVGMAGFFIDIGVIDPRDPDRYILGVECDGAAYHSSRYARDRDRLRQQILESRGWKIHRIWSTDWFYRNEREVAKLRAAIEASLAGGPIPTASEAYAPEYDEVELPAESGETLESDLDPSQPSLPRSAGLPPYAFANVDAGHNVQPHLLTDGQLAVLVERIVAVEQPIHEEEVGRRLAAACRLQRAGSRIQDAAGRGLRAARRKGRVRADGTFWMMADKPRLTARTRSNLPPAEQVRKPAMISPLELAEAARMVLVDNLALPLPELVVETARAVGFARTGNDVSAAIEGAIHAHLMPSLETDHLGRLRFSE